MLLFHYGIWRLGSSIFSTGLTIRGLGILDLIAIRSSWCIQPDWTRLDNQSEGGGICWEGSVKLANIHLTPGNPSYESGSWHVEGQLVSFTLSILPFFEIIFLGKNEHIWATALYYYSNESIKDSNFTFRQRSSTEAANETEYQQDHHE